MTCRQGLTGKYCSLPSECGTHSKCPACFPSVNKPSDSKGKWGGRGSMGRAGCGNQMCLLNKSTAVWPLPGHGTRGRPSVLTSDVRYCICVKGVCAGDTLKAKVPYPRPSQLPHSRWGLSSTSTVRWHRTNI